MTGNGVRSSLEPRMNNRIASPHFDKVLQQPIRLSTVAHLMRSGGSAPFTEISALIGIPNGKLSIHNRILEAEGYVELQKSFVDRRPQTLLVLTPKGRRAFANHKAMLNAMIAAPAMETAG
jgi:DNA-binding MarR family transcriptional regulator